LGKEAASWKSRSHLWDIWDAAFRPIKGKDQAKELLLWDCNTEINYPNAENVYFTDDTQNGEEAARGFRNELINDYEVCFTIMMSYKKSLYRFTNQTGRKSKEMRNKYICHLPEPSRTKKNEGKQHKKDVTMQVGGGGGWAEYATLIHHRPQLSRLSLSMSSSMDI